MKKKTKLWLTAALVVVCLGILCLAALLGINVRVKAVTAGRILPPQDAAALQDVDCILVLGCAVWDEDQPSHMLEDRLKRGVQLYEDQAAPKLLMSGDHGRVDYNEVGVMKQFAMDAGIPSADIFMDHAGFSTYESLYRARDIFGAQRILIVSQEYHLYRALYIARELGLDAYGVSADYRNYANESARLTREVLARCKDFVACIFQPEPTYLGEPICLTGSGDVTND